MGEGPLACFAPELGHELATHLVIEGVRIGIAKAKTIEGICLYYIWSLKWIGCGL